MSGTDLYDGAYFTSAGGVPVLTDTTPPNVLFYTDPEAGSHLWRFYRAFQFP